MVSWEECPESDGEEAWNELLLTAQDYSVFQSYGWGEYKRLAGWQPLRYLARNKGGTITGMAQPLLKIMPMGVKIAWIPGGPVVNFCDSGYSNAAKLIEGLMSIIKSSYSKILIRFDSYIPYDSVLAYSLKQYAYRPTARLNSGYTIQLNLSEIGDQFISQMTARHRYYARKASAEKIDWTVGNSGVDISTLLNMHGQMITRKGIDLPIMRCEEIKSLCRILGGGVNILTGYIEGEAVTSCLTLNFGRKSFYMAAASSLKGRKISASYAMIVQLVLVLQEGGITLFDFGGIDPVSPSAQGVNHFKRGFGGNVVEYLGEWEVASSALIRRGINFGIKMRGSRV